MVERVVRVVAPSGFALCVVVGVVLSDRPPLVRAVAAIVALTLAALLACRRPWGWPLIAGLLGSAAAVTVVCSGDPDSAGNVGWFALCVLAAWCALSAPIWTTAGFTAIVGVSLAVQWLADGDAGWGAWIAGTLVSSAAGASAQRQEELLDQLRMAQAGLAERAATEERTRIARELHDVIGHALTVSLLHVGSARLALREDLEEADAALAEAERLGRESLTEVRHAVGLLRTEEPTARSPLPAAAQLDALVDGFRRTGSDLAWSVEGDRSRLTAASGLTVYRILQEALTNAARHAPGAGTVARLLVTPDRTELTVHTRGTSTREPAVDGAGVAGMRERAEAVGGTLSAGPAAHGWRVHAVLPA